METISRTTVLLLLLIATGALSLLQVRPAYAAEQYVMRGAYNEMGTRDGAINITFYRDNQGPITFELDGEYLANASTAGDVLVFDLGLNETRTYYVYQNETVYVMKPYAPYYDYFFTLVDYIGLEWGYLESVVNLNGTERVCERQTIDYLNNIPFTFSWGRSYTMRIVCDQGEYTYGSYVAGATTEFTLAVSRDLFPVPRTDIGDLTVSATRWNTSWIRSIYIDANTTTNWVNFDIHEYGNSTPLVSYNTTSNSVIYNWYEGGSIDYYVVITIDHQVLGSKTWTFPCPRPKTDAANPFTALRYLGDFPFDLAQLPGVLIILAIAIAFSWFNAPLGIIVSVLVAFLLTWMGWLAMTWTWLGIAGSMGFILAFAMIKDRSG